VTEFHRVRKTFVLHHRPQLSQAGLSVMAVQKVPFTVPLSNLLIFQNTSLKRDINTLKILEFELLASDALFVTISVLLPPYRRDPGRT
jgi:hypothetical protein